MRIVFAGTPDFAVPALQALAGAGHDIAAVYTQPDRPAGRGRKLAASPVKQTALSLGIAVEQPHGLRDAIVVEALAACQPDVMIVVAYGLILPPAVLQIPRLGCINVHASLLPRWRGAAPIQRSILAGDRLSGVCIMRMEAGLDTGPVYTVEQTQIAATETAGSLHDRLAALGAAALVAALPAIEAGAQPKAQDAAGVTYAAKIHKDEAWIDWALPAPEIERKVRAFNPWPIAQARLRGEQLRIWAAHAVAAPSGSHQPGAVISADPHGVTVACGEGALVLDSVQLPGGKPMTAAAFLNSHSLNHVILT